MTNYNKIHLISDLHGYFEGLQKIAEVCDEQTPLFVLGDLFDHHYGEENIIIDLLLELDKRNALTLVKGNHDVVIDLAFNRILSDEETINKLTKEKNLKKFKIFKTIFNDDFYYQFLRFREELLAAGVSDELKLTNYYERVTCLGKQPQYIERYTKVQKLIELFVDYTQVEVNGTKLLLSHSGDINNPFSRETAKSSYSLDSKYDYGVMGHLTISKVEKMIEEEGDMIDYRQNFMINCQLPGLTIDGEYMYNSHSKMIMIDKGSDIQTAITIY